jgi:dienelactone hydrolase
VALRHVPLDPASVQIEAEELTVEQSFGLDLYTLFHRRNYSSWRVRFPGSNSADQEASSEGREAASEGREAASEGREAASEGRGAIAHLLLPAGPGPHPAVIVFPILAGSHVVSEGLAKALVRRGYAVLRLERMSLALEEAESAEEPMYSFRTAILDARRLLDWLEHRPDIDPARLAAAGVSLGGILAATLVGVGDRIAAGVFVMAGGGLAEILYDSTEKPVRAFRTRLMEREGIESREAFVAAMRPFTEPVDPLRYASRIDTGRTLLISGRFDRVIPRDRTEALWNALGGPTWLRFPAGHYQMFPFFWWAVGRGADHLDRVFEADEATGSARTAIAR